MTSPKPIPDGFHTVTAHLVARNAAAAIEFYTRAFGAEVWSRMNGPDGQTVMHASLCIGDSIIMLAEESPQWNCLAPASLGGSPVVLHLYVDDVDAWFQRAVGAGATVTMPVEDTFWGDRYGTVRDPFGHAWSIATHKEDLTPEQIEQRAAEKFCPQR